MKFPFLNVQYMCSVAPVFHISRLSLKTAAAAGSCLMRKSDEFVEELRKFKFSIIRIHPPQNHLDGLIDLECDIALDGLDKTGTGRLLSTNGGVVVPQPSVLS